jgi:hypothetical protein
MHTITATAKKLVHVTMMQFHLKMQDIIYKYTNAIAEILYQDIRSYEENMPITVRSPGPSDHIHSANILVDLHPTVL